MVPNHYKATIFRLKYLRIDFSKPKPYEKKNGKEYLQCKINMLNKIFDTFCQNVKYHRSDFKAKTNSDFKSLAQHCKCLNDYLCTFI